MDVGNRHNIKALLEAALAQHEHGFLTQAQALYHQVLESEPKQADAQHLLGVIELQLGHPELAVHWIESALKVHESPIFFTNLATSYQSLGDVEQAIHYYQRALQMDESTYEAHYQLAHILFEQEQFRLAQTHFEKALLLKEKEPMIFIYLAQIYMHFNSMDKALDCAQQALKLAPDLPQAHKILGDLWAQDANNHKKKARLDLAEQAYQQALKIRPAFGAAHSALATLYFKQGKQEAAIKSIKMALHYEPQILEYWFELAAFHEKSNQYREALSTLNRALLISPNNANVHYQHGLLWYKQGEFSLALQSFHKTLALNPQHFDARFYLANIEYERNEYSKAKQLLTPIYESSADFPAAIALAAQCLFHLHQTEEAIRLLLEHTSLCSSLLLMAKLIGFQQHLLQFEAAQKSVQKFQSMLNECMLTNEIFDLPLLHDFEYCALSREQEQWLVHQWDQPFLKTKALPLPKLMSEKTRVGYLIDAHDMKPLLDFIYEHDHEQYAVFVYLFNAEEKSEKFHSNHRVEFRHLFELSYEDLAKRIEKDGIDILIDTIGFGAQHSPEFFSFQPAPVMCSYQWQYPPLYFSHYDFVFSPNSNLAETDTQKAKTLILNKPFLSKKDIVTPSITLREYAQKPFTFCYAGELWRLDKPTLDVWRLILLQCPNSRLLLWGETHTHAVFKKEIAECFQDFPLQQIELVACTHASSLMAHADVWLEPFHMHHMEHTTEVLWNAVPMVVKQQGRQSNQCLENMLFCMNGNGMIARDDNEYIQQAVLLYHQESILNLRRGELLKARQNSPLFQPKLLAEQMEHYFDKISI